LERGGQSVLFVDQNDALGMELDLSVGTQVSGVLRLPRGFTNLENITGAYLRPYDSSRLPAIAHASPEVRARVAALDEALLCWSEVTPVRVVNRPSAMASNHSKPYQSALIHAWGFDVPETLVTTDGDALEAFWEKHGQIVYKSISGIRSIVTCLTPNHRERFADLSNCPTQFQQWIPGTDFRVHVVGDDVFACRVASSATDYRYPHGAEEAPEIQSYELPVDLADRCRRLVTSLSLELAGIDLRRTPEGQWFCFEVNPSPGFTYYEQATGQPIAESIACLLARQ
jgi:glutathione synthase/RimK-type ligase-like ATP-grasp enzyme